MIKNEQALELNKIIGRLQELTQFSLGRERAGALKPFYTLEEVKESLKETNDAEACIIKRGSPPMGGCWDIRPMLKRLEIGGLLGAADLLKIAGVLRATQNMKKYFADKGRGETEIDPDEDIIAGLIAALQANRTLEESISMAIVSEEEISDSASPELRNIRRQIRDTQESIKTKINDIIRSQKYQKYLQDAIVTVRGDRYVIPVKQEHRSEIQGLVHDSSASGATIFIEPMSVVEANNKIKQLGFKEQQEIERILAELSNRCGEFLVELQTNLEILAQLDFAFSKARLSLELKCVQPKINNQGIIKIRQGRHPLIDINLVVPIDFHIGKGFKSVIITGPNTGGKTVTLKTVGLFTLMAQCGLNVPAAYGTELSVFSNVFADIGDEQSIEQSLSTFSSHMKNIVKIIKKADDKSLVLLDELGAGTDPTEGAALAISILESLHQQGATVLATTHYSELKVYALTTKGVENASCEFDVETLKPTYRLLIGVPGKSNAFAISQRLGLDNNIIDRAKDFLTAEDVKFEDVMIKLEKNRAKAERERRQAEMYRKEVENLKKDLEEKRFDIEERRQKYLRNAQEEARELLEKAHGEAANILEEIRKIKNQSEEAVKLTEAEDLRIKLKKELDDLSSKLSFKLQVEDDENVPEDLEMGEQVKILSLGQIGTVVSPPKSQGNVQVQVGAMTINVDITNLRRTNEKKKKKTIKDNRNVGRISIGKSKEAVTEINVIGKNVEEANIIIDKFLDDSALANIKEVRIIHGKGTGALRNGVQQFLRRCKHVKSFRLGGFGEGESGVTIVTLK